MHSHSPHAFCPRFSIIFAISYTFSQTRCFPFRLSFWFDYCFSLSPTSYLPLLSFSDGSISRDLSEFCFPPRFLTLTVALLWFPTLVFLSKLAWLVLFSLRLIPRPRSPCPANRLAFFHGPPSYLSTNCDHYSFYFTSLLLPSPHQLLPSLILTSLSTLSIPLGPSPLSFPIIFTLFPFDFLFFPGARLSSVSHLGTCAGLLPRLFFPLILLVTPTSVASRYLFIFPPFP